MPDDKLTIVGPEPSGTGEKTPHKKVNIEALLLMAKYDEGFRKKLFSGREKALSESGLDFTPGERLLLANITDGQLAANIDEFRIPGINRNSLASWTKAAAVVLLLTSITIYSAGCGVTRGTTPNEYLIKGAVRDTGQIEQRIPPPNGLIPDTPEPPPPPPPPIQSVQLPPKPREPRPRPPIEGIMPDERLVQLENVYFKYDRSDLTDEAKRILEANAKILKEFNDYDAIIIKGHCDERGTEEYNLALGQRRAESVKKYLVSLGVPNERLRTISYGEAQPENVGHDESAWNKNRRVELLKVKE